MLRRRTWQFLGFLVAAAGCDGPAPEPAPVPPPPAAIGANFDPTAVGSISGRVTWDGPIPSFPPVLAPVFLPTGVEQRRYPHPNAPVIDPASRAVRGAVVYLEGVDPTRARRWQSGSLQTLCCGR